MAEDAILGAKKQICQVTDRMVSDTIWKYQILHYSSIQFHSTSLGIR